MALLLSELTCVGVAHCLCMEWLAFTSYFFSVLARAHWDCPASARRQLWRPEKGTRLAQALHTQGHQLRTPLRKPLLSTSNAH